MATIDEELLEAQQELGIGEDFDDDEIGYVDVVGEDDEYDDDVEGFDIEGDDDVGARRRRKRRRRGRYNPLARRRRRRIGQSRINVPAPGNKGDSRVWALPCTAVASMAAAAVGTLTFTPNRNISIVGVTLDVYVAAAITTAAMFPAAIQITNITVQGRSQFPGAGVIPLSAFQPINAQRWAPVQFENCMASQSVVITLVNADAATTHIAVGCLWVVTVA